MRKPAHASLPTRAIRSALLRWYDRNARPLPWRRSRDPYPVWIAETMLQQTRIAAVVPLYDRFLARFPTLESLARASEDEVLSQWSGLGYYSRARNLRRAAQQLIERTAPFPRTYDEIRELPGIGAYTAAAVLSIAFEVPVAAVDGNVVRVLSRMFRLPRPDSRNEPYQSLASALLSRRRPGDWNQALMELGETACIPKRPNCARCPVARWCEAKKSGETDRFPPPKQRRARESLECAMTVVYDAHGRVLLERGAFPFLRHMWLPLFEHEIESSAQRELTRGESTRQRRLAGTVRHAILHRDLTVHVWRTDVDDRRFSALAREGERKAFEPHELTSIGRSGLLTKALAAASSIPKRRRQS